MIYFDKGDECGAWLRYHTFRMCAFDIFNIRFCSEFRAKADIKNCLDADGFKPAVELEVPAFEGDCDCRRYDCNEFFLFVHSGKEFISVVDAVSCSMRAGGDACSAANA